MSGLRIARTRTGGRVYLYDGPDGRTYRIPDDIIDSLEVSHLREQTTVEQQAQREYMESRAYRDELKRELAEVRAGNRVAAEVHAGRIADTTEDRGYWLRAFTADPDQAAQDLDDREGRQIAAMYRLPLGER